MGGRILGVVRLIFCFFSLSAGLGAGAGAGASLEAGFSSSWPLSSQRFFLGEGLVTLDLLALSRFSLELLRCIFSSLSTSCFLEFRKSSYFRAAGSASFLADYSGTGSGGLICVMMVLGAGI